MRIVLIIFLLLSWTACSVKEETASNAAAVAVDELAAKLSRQKQAVAPFFSLMSVREGDWLSTQTEAGETFEQYIRSNPTLPTETRRTIYILPVGDFSSAQKQVISDTADYMRAFYSLPVKQMAARPLGNVPAGQHRMSGYPSRKQIRTNYFLDTMLPRILPADAAALIAFTANDLYPGETWAFVFGQATFEKRVGVWSLYRFSDKLSGTKKLLPRTLKIAMHETGHMFSMKHCTKYECLMSGTNHLDETDRRPLDNCPECMAKLSWAMKYDPAERYRKLAAFWKKHGDQKEADLMLKKAKAVEAVK